MSDNKMGFSLDKFGEEDVMGLVVRYGLFIGAIFQFVCMASAVLMTGNDALTEGESNESNEIRVVNEPPQTNPNVTRRLHKIRKLEKKKRR